MRTLEAILTAERNAHACRIEGPEQNSTSVSDQEVVDFDIIGESGDCLVAAQVKSSGAGRSISAHNAFSVLARLIRSGDSLRYELITNATPDRQCFALMEVLRRQLSPNDLYGKLEAILSRSQVSLTILSQLTPDELCLLTRARIVHDSRTDQEIRRSLYTQLRKYRVEHGLGLANHSGGLLIGYLLSEIHRRASEGTGIWNVADFEAECLTSNKTLIAALGRKDWGVICGPVAPVPDIHRPMLLRDLEHALPDNSAVESIRICALTGLSGIGKSSLASAYIAENAFKYDLILWIDATSRESLELSFRRLQSRMAGELERAQDGDDSSMLREGVHSWLASVSGRWLAVFDDASPEVVNDWLPVLGSGDVLITSIDSAAWHRCDAKVEVSSMTADEAVSLIRKRLRLTESQAVENQTQIRDLALALEYWPLALELSCGYMASCAIDISNVDDYLHSLASRALNDSFSVPRGYPRTLVAAMHLNLRHIRDLARLSGDGWEHAVTQMLGAACFFHAQRIPVHLVTVSGLIDPDEVSTSSGSVVVNEQESDLPVREIVRLLIRVSFARYDAPIAPLSYGSNIKANDTISLNSVLQVVLRDVFSKSSPLREMLSISAFHVERWLREALDDGAGIRAREIFLHANELMEHVKNKDAVSNHTALLLGNISSFHYSQGRQRQACDLLRLELDWLSRIPEPNELLEMQTRVSLASILLNQPALCMEGESASDYLIPLKDYIPRIAEENPQGAAFLAAECAFVLDYAAKFLRGSNAASKAAGEFFALLSALPQTGVSSTIAALSKVAELLGSNQNLDQAIVVARNALARARESRAQPVMELRRLLIEALVHKLRWEEASTEFSLMAPYLGKHSLYHHSMLNLVHNVGLWCALHWGVLGERAGMNFLSEIFSVVSISDIASRVEEENERLRYRLLEALMCYEQGGLDAFDAKLTGIDLAALDSGDASDVAWVAAASAIVSRIRGGSRGEAGGRVEPKSDPVEFRRAADSTEANCRLFTATEYETLLTSMSVDVRIPWSWPADDTPVVVLEPRYILVSTHKTTRVTTEIQIQSICMNGFHDPITGSSRFPLSPGWKLEVQSDELNLRDGFGGLWAVAQTRPSPEWVEAADRAGVIRVLYGWGFDLFEYGAPVPGTDISDFAEAAEGGFLASALVGWGGARVVPPHVKHRSGQARMRKGKKRRRK